MNKTRIVPPFSVFNHAFFYIDNTDVGRPSLLINNILRFISYCYRVDVLWDIPASPQVASCG